VLQGFMDWIALAQGILAEGASRKDPEAGPAGQGAPIPAGMPIGTPPPPGDPGMMPAGPPLPPSPL